MAVIGSTTISWPDDQKRNRIMWKAPRNIRLNDNVVVREDEYAIFFRDGKVLTVFDRADRYALTSMNAPVVGTLVKFLTGAEQEASVYYAQRRVFDGRFGTSQPLLFKDSRFGMVSLRAYGEFRYRVADPVKLITQFVGTLNSIDQDYVTGRINERVLMALNQSLGELKKQGHGVVDLPENLGLLEQLVLAKCPLFFEEYGLLVTQVSGLSVSLPEDVQKRVDEAAADRATATMFDGDTLGRLTAYQRAKAIRAAAENPSGGAAMGVGIGAGISLGKELADQVSSPPIANRHCPNCGEPIASAAKFCGSCGTQLGQPRCSNCGAQNSPGHKFCASCGTKLAP